MRKRDLIFFMSRNAKCTVEMLEYVKNENEDILSSLSTERARKAYSLAREVGKEIHMAKSFTRLKFSKNGVLYGNLKVKHNTEDLIAKFFARRFPDFVIILQSWRGCFIFGGSFQNVIKTDEDINEIISSISKPPQIDMEIFEDEKIEKFWEDFYNSQYIPSRKNLRLLKRNIPKKYNTWEYENLPRLLGCKKLSEIITK